MAKKLHAVGRLGGFTSAVLLSTLVGFISTPVLFRTVGPELWANLLVGQVVAGIASVLVVYGWGVAGAATVAGLAPIDRPGYFFQSLRIRSVLFSVVFPVSAVVATLITQGDAVAGVLGTGTYLVPSLSAAWYFIGEGSPRRLLLLDAFPGLVGTLVGVGAVLATHQLWVFLLAQLSGYFFAVVGSALRIRADRDAAATAARTPWRALMHEQRHAVITSVTSSLYVSLPYLLVRVLLPSSAGVYGLADRTLKYASVAYSPITQFFQGWVAARGEDTRSRAKTAGLMGLVGGFVGGVGLAVIMPGFTFALSGGTLSVPFEVSIPLGVAFVGIGTSAVVGLACLIALRRTNALAVSTVIGAAVGTPLLIASALFGTPALVAWSLAVSELSVATYQLLALRRALREPESYSD